LILAEGPSCEGRSRNPGTEGATIRGVLRKYAGFQGRRLSEIDEQVIETYKQCRVRTVSRRKRALSVASVNRELATLRRMLRLAHEWKLVDRVPKIRLLRGEKAREFVLSPKDEALYLGALDGDLHDVAVLLLDTGLRIGEALSLEWSDVRLVAASGAKFGYLTVRAGKAKNSKSRNVSLTARALSLLATRSTETGGAGYVFQRSGGSKLYLTWLNEQHRTVRDYLKLPAEFVPHSLRHTFGTRLGEAGADAFTIMRLMGHSTVTVSQRYVHPSRESVERAFDRLER
jgi:integrase